MGAQLLARRLPPPRRPNSSWQRLDEWWLISSRGGLAMMHFTARAERNPEFLSSFGVPGMYVWGFSPFGDELTASGWHWEPQAPPPDDPRELRYVFYNRASWKLPRDWPNALHLPPWTRLVWNRQDESFSNAEVLHTHRAFVSIPHALLVFPAAILPLFWLRRFRRARRQRFRERNGLCLACGYDLRAHAPGQRCPECGTLIPADLVRTPMT